MSNEMDSGSKMGLGLLAVGAAAVIALMLKLHGHPKIEIGLGVFLALQVWNAVLIIRAAARDRKTPNDPTEWPR